MSPLAEKIVQQIDRDLVGDQKQQDEILQN
jgi:hypothetical protein